MHLFHASSPIVAAAADDDDNAKDDTVFRSRKEIKCYYSTK